LRFENRAKFDGKEKRRKIVRALKLRRGKMRGISKQIGMCDLTDLAILSLGWQPSPIAGEQGKVCLRLK